MFNVFNGYFLFYGVMPFVFIVLSDKPRQNQERGLVDRKLVKTQTPPHRPHQRWLFGFGSLLILDVVCRYLSLFLLYINMKIGKNRC